MVNVYHCIGPKNELAVSSLKLIFALHETEGKAQENMKAYFFGQQNELSDNRYKTFKVNIILKSDQG